MPPRWDNKEFPKGANANRLVPLASGRDKDIEAGALYIHQDATLYGATLEASRTINHTLIGSQAYLVAARGRLNVNGTEIGARDGAVHEAPTVHLPIGPNHPPLPMRMPAVERPLRRARRRIRQRRAGSRPRPQRRAVLGGDPVGGGQGGRRAPRSDGPPHTRHALDRGTGRPAWRRRTP